MGSRDGSMVRRGTLLLESLGSVPSTHVTCITTSATIAPASGGGHLPVSAATSLTHVHIPVPPAPLPATTKKINLKKIERVERWLRG